MLEQEMRAAYGRDLHRGGAEAAERDAESNPPLRFSLLSLRLIGIRAEGSIKGKGSSSSFSFFFWYFFSFF